MARKAEAIFFRWKEFCGRASGFFLSPPFLLLLFCLFFRWNLQASFAAKGPGAPLRGGGAFVQVVPGKEVAGHRGRLAGKGWCSAGHNLNCPFSLREGAKKNNVTLASCLGLLMVLLCVVLFFFLTLSAETLSTKGCVGARFEMWNLSRTLSRAVLNSERRGIGGCP